MMCGMANGFKRCGCRDGDGKPLGAACPKLRRGNGSWNPAHGTWYGQAELPPAPDGTRQKLKAGGFRTETEMGAWFTAAVALLSIPAPGPAGHRDREQILAMIRSSRQHKAPLPDYDDIRRRYQHGTAFEAGTTGEYLQSWLAGRERAGDISRNTLRGYRSHIDRLFLPAFGAVPLDQLKVSHINRMLDAIDAENNRIREGRASSDPDVRRSVAGRRQTGPATMQRILATLRSALSDAARAEHPLIAYNPAKAARLPKVTRPKPREWTPERTAAFWDAHQEAVRELTITRHKLGVYLSASMRPYPVMLWTPAQTGAFLDSVADDRLYPMWQLFAFTGMRRGEVAGLRWADLDLDHAVAHVETQLTQLGWEVAEETPKTDASAAPVSLDKATVALLRAWRKAQMADQLAMAGDWIRSGRVFTHLDGSALHPAQITSRFERAAFDARLPPIRLHDLRHGAASLAHASGADMKAISAMLRHASLAITADTYTSVFADQAAALAENIASIVPRLRRAAGGDPAQTSGPTTVPNPSPDPREDPRWP